MSWTSLMMLGLAAITADTSPPAVGDRHVDTVVDGTPSAYRLFVPEDWKPGDHWPLVTILHGGGGDENSPFDRAPGFAAKLEDAAREHHVILLSPRGGKGWWGARMLPPEDRSPAGPDTYRMPPAGAITGPPPKLSPLSDSERAIAAKDVLQSEDAVQRLYGTDPKRRYLMGNSMGGVGTLHLAQAYPKRWCAISPSDGPVDPATYPFDRAKGAVSAALFVHGDNDRTAPIESMRTIAEGFKKEGVPTQFLTVAGGSHVDSWQRSLPEIFGFFGQHTCRAGSAGK